MSEIAETMRAVRIHAPGGAEAMRVETVPGDHNSMLTGENAAALGAKLAALIP